MGRFRATLADPYLKTERARQHLDALQSELETFKNTKPHRFKTERDIVAREYRVHFEVEDVPDRILLIVGDFLTCLRASLDHLVWQLASITKPYPKSTEFPILDAPNAKHIKACTKGVPDDARKVIVSLQPYQAGQAKAIHGHFLWRLNKLCNIDKHRRIPVHSNASTLRFPDIPKKFVRHLEFNSAVDAGAGTVTAPLELEQYMRLDSDTDFNIIFGDSFEGIEIDVEGIVRLYKYVTDDVLPRFARFF